LEHDGADLERKITCPTLVFYGAGGAMAKCFDIPAEWAKRSAAVRSSSLPGGHFFVDQFAHESANILSGFLHDPHGA
jgi:haloacetate dehalogenase